MRTLIQMSGRTELYRLMIYLIAPFLLIASALASPWRGAVVSGKSMYPTLKPNEMLVYDKSYYARNPFRVGDVVLLKHQEAIWVKRIYAVPGQTFWAFNDRLDGAEHFTPISPDDRHQFEKLANGLQRESKFAEVVNVRVRPGHLFVLGDGHRSEDSSSFGQIPSSQILGRVMELPWQHLHRKSADSEWSFPSRT